MYHILVKNQPDTESKNKKVTMDGRVLEDGLIPLKDDEQIHEIVVMISA
jgi:hypothetical protein